jgi:glycosyltransferase involved in cell wall biosynthesis
MFVSVIIPTYNRAVKLCEAIESVLAQDYSEKEIIVVDDGSTDDTAEVVKSFGNEVDYIFTENGGVSRARNVGISRGSGELIAFLDSDDLWLPGKLKRQVEFLQTNPEIHICQTEEVWIRNGKRVNPKNIHKKYSGWIFEHCIPRCIVSPSAVAIRREIFDDVGLFDETMPACEDYDLWLRIAPKYQIITLPEALILKRGGHSDQLSKQWGLDIWRIHALEKVLKTGVDEELAEKIRKDILRRANIVALGAKKRGKLDIAKCFDEKLKMYSRHPNNS